MEEKSEEIYKKVLKKMKKKKVSRNLELSEKEKRFLQAYVKCFGNISATCRLLKVCRGTFIRLRKRSEAFSKALEESRAVDVLVDCAEEKLMEKVKEGDTKAILFVLETRGKERGWSKNPEIAVAVVPKIVVQQGDVGFFSDAQETLDVESNEVRLVQGGDAEQKQQDEFVDFDELETEETAPLRYEGDVNADDE